MIVVHPDVDFLDDIAGKLKEVCTPFLVVEVELLISLYHYII
jgi:hypothetical protein